VVLAIIAAIIFAIAFVLRATHTATGSAFSTLGLVLIGLACLALHIAGIGSGWSLSRRYRR
jgi:hypothetical protein